MAVVDASDFVLINKFKWHVSLSNKGVPYASGWIKQNGKRVQMRMHKYLMAPKKGQEIDHINHNTLDNRRSNLRICTRSENLKNRKQIRKDILTGAHWNKLNMNWNSSIAINGKKKHLGCFSTMEAAHKAFLEAKNANNS